MVKSLAIKKTLIRVLFQDGSSKDIYIKDNIRGLIHNGQRPIDFYIEEYGNEELSEDIEEWFKTEFLYIFDKNSSLFDKQEKHTKELTYE